MSYEFESKLENFTKFFDEDFLPFLLVGHYDADGLISLSIIAKLLYIKKIPFIFRISEVLNANEIKESAFYKIIIVDFQITEEISKIGEEKRILVIDHHPIRGDAERLMVIHPVVLGINDDVSSCSSTLSYLLARCIDDSFIELSPLAIAGALEDRLDREDKRGFRGINKIVLEEAEEVGLINKEEGLICYGDFSETLLDVLVHSFEPFFPNLFSSRESALEYLKGCDIANDLLDKPLNEIQKEQQAEIGKKLAKRMLKEGFRASIIEKIYGYNYSTSMHSKYRNLRFIAKSIDFIARSMNYGEFIDVLFKDRLHHFSFEKYFNEYINVIDKILLRSMREKRKKEYKKLYFLSFEGKIDRYVGSFANLLSSSNINKPVIVIASEFGKDMYKLSLRSNNSIDADLGSLASIISKKLNGSGGGHKHASGAIVPKENLNAFLEELDASL